MHVPDLEYLVAAAHSGEHDRLPEPVWCGEPGGHRRAGNRGDGGEHGGGGVILQGDGWKAERVRLSAFHLSGYPRFLYNDLLCTRKQEQDIIRIKNGIKDDRRWGYGY